MIWILATRNVSTKLRASPYTETVIEGAESVIYRPGITPIPHSGLDIGDGALGTFYRGLQRISGYVFSYEGAVAETLLAVNVGIDLIIRYRANSQARKRILKDVLFAGDATVTTPGLNTGISEVIGVPFRVQIPESETLADHIEDMVDA